MQIPRISCVPFTTAACIQTSGYLRVATSSENQLREIRLPRGLLLKVYRGYTMRKAYAIYNDDQEGLHLAEDTVFPLIPEG